MDRFLRIQKLRNVAILLVLAGASAAPSSAVPISYEFLWTGSSGYTMKGTFGFDTSSGGDARIDETELLSLSISGYLNGTLVGAWTLGVDPYVGAQAFNFNFNPVTELFYVGGHSSSVNGQNWNDDGSSGTSCGDPGLGLNAGSGGQDLCVDGVLVGSIPASTPLSAMQSPEPGTVALFGLGLAGLFIARRKRGAAPPSGTLGSHRSYQEHS